MAPSMSSARELQIASAKRPASSDISGSDSEQNTSESVSDFEETKKATKMPPKKKSRTNPKASAPVTQAETAGKIPKDYQSNEGNALFSAKWYKEVTKRDNFWEDFAKKVPKAVLSKRLKVEVFVGNNSDAAGVAPDLKTTANTTIKAKGGAAGRKPAAKATAVKDKPLDKPNINNDEDDAVATPINGAAEIQDTEMKDTAAAIQTNKPTTVSASDLMAVNDTPTQQTNDDLLSQALANPDLTPEKRKEYEVMRDRQIQIQASLEMERAREAKLQANREKRAAAKEKKTAKEAEDKVKKEAEAVEARAEAEAEVKADAGMADFEPDLSGNAAPGVVVNEAIEGDGMDGEMATVAPIATVNDATEGVTTDEEMDTTANEKAADIDDGKDASPTVEREVTEGSEVVEADVKADDNTATKAAPKKKRFEPTRF